MKKIIVIIFSFFMFTNKINAISASGYVVMDIDSNRVLMGDNIHNTRLIASISKIMTCIIAIENGDLEKEIIVDKSILKAIGSSIYIEVGEKINLKDLLYGLMLRSGNDAAILIANEISGSMDKFGKVMNEYAKKIGMTNTKFYNSHGLEEDNGLGNTSSAYDMALLTSYAMENDTFKEIFKTKKYIAKSDKKTYVWQNKNKLLNYDYVNGGKTGYTQKAKRTLVTTAKINDVNVVIVTLNDGNDWNDHLSLYESIKKDYKKIKIISKDDFEILDDTYYVNDTLYIKNDISFTLKKVDLSKLKIKYFLQKKKKYRDDEKIGYLEVYLNDILLGSESIYIRENSVNKSFWKKLIEKIF